MRSLLIVGLILTAISGFMFYYTTDFNINNWESSHYMGIMGGIGIGLIIGGVVGYVSKGSAIREAQRREEIRALEEEKKLLEKQNAKLEAQKQTQSYTVNDNKPNTGSYL